MTIKPIIAWYDLWVGAFWDRRARKLYLLPLPCVGIVLDFASRSEIINKPEQGKSLTTE